MRRCPQPATSWSAVGASPRASSAPWAKPSSCASNSTCTAPRGWLWPRKGTDPPRPVFPGTACALTKARHPGLVLASSALGDRLRSVPTFLRAPRGLVAHRRARPLAWNPARMHLLCPGWPRRRSGEPLRAGAPTSAEGQRVHAPGCAAGPPVLAAVAWGCLEGSRAEGQQVCIYRHEVRTSCRFHVSPSIVLLLFSESLKSSVA